MSWLPAAPGPPNLSHCPAILSLPRHSDFSPPSSRARASFRDEPAGDALVELASGEVRLGRLERPRAEDAGELEFTGDLDEGAWLLDRSGKGGLELLLSEGERRSEQSTCACGAQDELEGHGNVGNFLPMDYSFMFAFQMYGLKFKNCVH